MIQSNVIPFPTHRVEATAASVQPNNSKLPNSTPRLENRTSTAQDFDVQALLPETRKVRLIEASKGTHQIPHKIFEFMVKTTANRVEMAVFACLLRYTLGFHRPTCEASHSFISEWTGLSVASIRRGLNGLLSAKLVQCVEPGNRFKDSTIYELPIVKAYLAATETAHQNDKPLPVDSKSELGPEHEITKPKNQEPLCPAQNYATSVHRTVPPAGTKKDNTNILKENTTHTSASEYLKTYFSALKPEQKKTKEYKHYQSLKCDYSNEDIADAVRLLTEEGIPGSKNSCHSPMAFLACSMESILSEIKTRREKISRREATLRLEIERKQAELKQEKEDSERLDRARRYFEQAFPTEEEKQEFFGQFAIRMPFFSRDSFALKAAAISEWASKQKF